MLGRHLLAAASTVAGSHTRLGSAAHILVAERSRDPGGTGRTEHLRVGLSSAVLTTAAAMAWALGRGMAGLAPPTGSAELNAKPFSEGRRLSWAFTTVLWGRVGNPP